MEEMEIFDDIKNMDNILEYYDILEFIEIIMVK